MADKSKLAAWPLVKRVPHSLAALIGNTIPLWTYHRLTPRDRLGFVYHLVSAEPVRHVQHLFAYKTPAMFESDLYFLRNNYELVSYRDLFASHQRKRSGRKGRPSAFLSFDDGLAECYSVVRPILLRNQVPCVFFIITDCINNREMMYRHKVSLCLNKVMEGSGLEREAKLTELAPLFECVPLLLNDFINRLLALKEADGGRISHVCDILGVDWRKYLQVKKPYVTEAEIKMLARDGFTIGAHSQKHALLGNLAPAEIEREIVASCHDVKDITGEKQIPFAFPFSGDRIDRSFLYSLRQKHPIVGPLFDTCGIAVDEPFVFNRVPVDCPSPNGTKKSNIPFFLRQEYRSHLSAAFKERCRDFLPWRMSERT